MNSRFISDEQAKEASDRVRQLAEFFQEVYPELRQVMVVVVGGPQDQEHETASFWTGAVDDFAVVNTGVEDRSFKKVEEND